MPERNRFRSINNELMATDEFEVMSLEADEDEHSIEMHLPYIARVMQRQSPGYAINTKLSNTSFSHPFYFV